MSTSTRLGVAAAVTLMVCWIFVDPKWEEPRVAERPVSGRAADSGGALLLDRPSDSEPRAAGGANAQRLAVSCDADSECCRLTILVRSEQGLTPVADQRVDVVCFGDVDPWKRARVATTDSNGAALLQALPPGEVRVRLQNGVEAEGVLAKSESSTIEVLVPAMVQVTGSVQDSLGRAVPFAEVWKTGHGNPSLMSRIAVADAQGRFEFRHLAKSLRIAALDRRHVRSPLAAVTAPAGDSQNLILVLADGVPARLQGSIRAESIRPGFEAVVRVEPAPIAGMSSGGVFGNLLSYPICLRGVSSGFEVESLPAGAYQVTVEAAGYVAQELPVEIQAGESKSVSFELLRGHELRGRVLDESDGAPVGGAYVSASVEGHLAGYSAFSNEDGEFLLEGLPDGTASLFAEHAQHGQARATATLPREFAQPLVLAMSRGPEIRGRIDADPSVCRQTLKVGMRKTSRRDLPLELLVSLDPSGSFRLRNCEDEAYDLEVFASDGERSVRVLTQPGIRPGGEAVVIRVSGDQMPSAWITGQVVNAAGQPIQGVVLFVGNARSKSGERIDSRLARFRIGPYPPGEYEIDVSCQGFGTVALDPITLDAAGQVDLGLIVLEPPGSLEVKMCGQCTPRGSSGVLKDRRGRIVSNCAFSNGIVAFGPLTGGDYTFECRSGESLVITERLRVVAGASTVQSIACASHP